MDAPLVGPVRAPDLHVMTWNVRRRVRHLGRRSPDLWSRRRDLVRRLLDAERPAVLGVQEALPDQLELVTASLGPDYRWVGRGRDAAGVDEHAALVYDTARLRVTAHTHHALSATPHVPGSRTWGNLLPRAVVAAELTDLATGAELLVLSTHLDHLSGRAREASARMLHDLVTAADRPVVVLADANAPVGSAPYRALTRAGALVDPWDVAERRLTPAWGTFSRYRDPVPGGPRIDWLLVTPDVHVQATGVNVARFDGAAPSDHEPVQAVLRL
jgi:endonuclease/exonuclease/phosphatase family metal-dependent hydrolase